MRGGHDRVEEGRTRDGHESGVGTGGGAAATRRREPDAGTPANSRSIPPTGDLSDRHRVALV